MGSVNLTAMFLPISLSKKLVSLVAFTLVLELIFVGTLAILQQRAEAEAEVALRSTRISDAVNTLSREIYALLAILNVQSFSREIFQSGKIARFRENVEHQYEILKAEEKNHPAELSIVLKSEESANKGLAIFAKLEKDLSPLDDEIGRRNYIGDLKLAGGGIISEDFIDLNRKEKAIARRSPQKQADIRNKQRLILWIAVVINVLGSMAAALWLVRGITGRLNIMTENALRFASGKDLNPVLSGKDEIAMLDQTFHEMAASVREATRKERAVVENARDVICSIDSEGQFIALNPAAERLLLYKPAELIGRKFVSLVVASDVDHVLDAVERSMKGEEIEPLEACLRRSDGVIIDTLWSMHWSSMDNSLFCIIHDDSARKQAERLRQSLIAMITHDLKSPLSFIGNFLELLEQKIVGELNSQGEPMIAMANNSVAQMTKMVNDMLDMEKVKAGMIILSPVDISLKSLFDTACGPLAAVSASQGITLAVQSIDDLVHVDAEMIIRVITNLITNAMKFSAPGTTIRLTAERRGAVVSVNVCDQGSGIPEHLLDFVFEKYAQVPGTHKEGSGLGLAICKAFIEMNGGIISVKSKENEGTTVTFELPVANQSQSQFQFQPQNQ